MKNTIFLIVSFLTLSFISSCQKSFSGEDEITPYDSDAQSFIASAQISDLTQQVAINNFVLLLKQDSLWTKFSAIYPMLGGTSSSTKWNLKDPRDLDAAYRITWIGAPDFKATGVACLTDKDWGDTHLNDNFLIYNNASLSFYSGTQNQVAGYDMGCSNHLVPFNIMAIYEDFRADIVNTWFNAYGDVPHQPAITVGLFTASSYAGKVARYDNGVKVGDFGPAQDAHTGKNITIGHITDDERIGLRECRFAAIGEGLSDDAALKFYNAVKSFETSLSR